MTTTDQTKQAAANTLEPWVHGDNGLIYGQCGEDDVEAPFVCDVIEDSAMQALGMLSPAEEANARRIVAAVNACEGISTEALEQGVIRDLRETLQSALPILEDHATHIRLVSGSHGRSEAYAKALAALAKAGTERTSA